MKKIPRFIPSLSLRELAYALFFHEKRKGEVSALEKFAKKFAKYLGVSFAVPAPSARIALAALLNAMDIPRGGEVIMPSLTFHAIPAMFKKFGFRVRFVDIDPFTYCIDTTQILEAIASSTVAIMPVHMYGRACNMDVIMDIAKKYNLVVIEDCAQSCGAWYAGKRLGSFGQGAIFSLHHHKNFPVLGCGMLATNSQEIADKALFWMRSFPSAGGVKLIKDISYAAMLSMVTKPACWNGVHYLLRICNKLGFDLIEALTNESPEDIKKTSAIKGYMPVQLHGRIGLLQLKKIDALNRKRIYNGNKLWKYLRKIPGIEVPTLASEGENIYSTFVIKVKDRRTFRRKMFENGIDIHFGNMFAGPYLPGFEGSGKGEAALDAVKRMVHLPVYPYLKDEDVERIAESVIVAASS